MVLYIAAPPPDHKTCSKCSQCEKHYKCKSARDGLSTKCVHCHKAYKVANKDKTRASNKRYYEQHKDTHSAHCKARYEKHKDEVLAQHKKWREQHPDKVKEYREKHRDKRNAASVEYRRNRRQTDDAFRLLGNCRARLTKALKGELKVAKTLELIGCTPDELLEHLERTMSPEVRALRDDEVEIVVDHIIPCAAFDFSIPEHQRICFHFTNLQYLDKPTNGSKSDKVPDGFNFASWFEAARARVL